MIYFNKHDAFLERNAQGNFPDVVYECVIEGYRTVYSPDCYAMACYIPEWYPEDDEIYRVIRKVTK